VGVNIGKSKVTPLDEAKDDYVASTKRLVGLADYLVVNVSSPNTPGLRQLQGADFLSELLAGVVEHADVPVFLKLAPDLTREAVEEAVGLAKEEGVAGIIASNTTIRRDVLRTDPGEAGGLSGAPLRPLARACIDAALDAAGDLPVIGVGGISTAEHASELLGRGCAAVQVYTGFIYEGPGLPARLNRGLAHR